MSLYPKDEEIIMFGEKLKFPGLKDGKFTNGSFIDPKQLASFIPAETINLILDNLEEFIKSVGLETNSESATQLKEALLLRTNNVVLSERLEKLINIESPSDEPLSSDNDGILYSKTINLKEALAEKIKKKKENIKIVNWNIFLVPNYKDYSIDNKIDMPHNLVFHLPECKNFVSLFDYQRELITTAFCLFRHLEYEEIKDFERDVIFIQIADEFTEDIRNIKNESLFEIAEGYKDACDQHIHLDNVVQKYKTAALQTAFFDAYPEVAVNRIYNFIATADIYSTATSYIFNDSPTASTKSGFMATKNIDYFSALAKNTIKHGEKEVAKDFISVACSRYDSTSKLFYGDEIKINIASLFDRSYCMRNSCQFDVEVRYSIIGN